MPPKKGGLTFALFWFNFYKLQYIPTELIKNKLFLTLFLSTIAWLIVPEYLYAQNFNSTKQNDIAFLSESSHWIELDVEINSWWIKQDDEGFIWFNSSEGLCKFDGSNFYYFKHKPNLPLSIPNGFITEIAFQNTTDLIWIGFRKLGLYLYDLSTEKIVKKYTLSKDAVSSIIISSSDDLWVITEDNMLQFLDRNIDEFTSYKIPIPENHQDKYQDTSPGRILEDVNDPNILWIASKFGLYKFDIEERSFSLFDVDNYVEPINYQFATPVFQTEDGLIWYGHFKNEGVKVFDPLQEKWIAKMPVRDISSSFTFDIKPYGDSLLVASIRPDHFLVMDKYDPGQYTIVESTHEVAKFSCLAVDKNLNLYSTSPTGKLTKLNRYWFTFEATKLTDKEGKKFFPWCVFYDKTSKIYYMSSADGGHIRLYTKTFEFIDEISLIPSGCSSSAKLNAIKKDELNNMIYVATSDGLFSYDITTSKVEKELGNSEFRNYNFQEIKIKSDMIWLISQSNILSYNLITQQTNQIELPQLKSSGATIRDIEFIANDQMFVSTTRGLLLYDFNKSSFRSFTTSGLDVDLTKIMNCNSLIYENGITWLGTLHDGLYKINRLDSTSFHVKVYYHPISALTNTFNSISLINDQIWGSTSSGFTVFDIGKEDFISFQKTDGVFRSYRKPEFNPGGDQSQVVPYLDGIYHFYPNEIEADIVDPYLLKVSVNNQEINFKKSEQESTPYSFTHKQKDVYFELGAQNFGVENKTFYRYRLVGLDDTWKFLDENRFISFANLPQGSYTLEYDARSFHSYWNEAPSMFKFKIEAHPLMTPLFKLFWVLLGGIIIFLVFRKLQYDKNKEVKLLDLQRQRAESELKALKAQMNPHFLFNTLNSINWYIIKNKSLEASKYLTKFSKLMRLILENSKVERISLARELETLELYTQLEAVRFENVFTYEFRIDPEIDPEKYLIPPLIFQPFIENAIWHGLVHKEGTGSIVLEIKKEKDHLKCIIEDNGIGRQEAQKIKDKASQYRKSNGIEITRKRIEGINKHVNEPLIIIDLIDDRGRGVGTRIEILLPIMLVVPNTSLIN